jgi:hypothetical protein
MSAPKFLNTRVTANHVMLYINLRREDFSETEWAELVLALGIKADPFKLEFIQIQQKGADVSSMNFY